MDDAPTTEAAFRTEARAFLEGVPDLLDGIDQPLERARRYLGARFDAGLGALDYAVEYGGRGLDRGFVDIFRDEASGREPGGNDAGLGIGIGMCLPTIRDHGSDALKDRFLRPGLRGEEVWCQLYSEPGAGSDLAGLTTRAERDGDEWIVTGQKVWTSGAEVSDLGILLARTDPDVPKHRGISMLVLPMRQPGVEIRPLMQMTGVSQFNEVFIDEARIPAGWIVGEEGGGWQIAVALLAHERASIGAGGGRQPIPTARIIDLAHRRAVSADPRVRQDLARLHTGTRIIEWLNRRDGIHPSVTKLWRTRQGRDAALVAARIAFPAGPAWAGARVGTAEPDPGRDFTGADWAYGILDSPAHSLGGGTDEIQRTTLGERVLGLPREPAVDRDVPFSQVRRSR
ncbi:MAG: acyl-CoA dehydrogenase family protein [Acidimicrobiales bacterium]|jgi:alkylation response protein AidB-like acyl-CoA dehydrogenase|nr:acyl-CoA dehydrogenase family protein [Acidimicrobiales bacterium]